MKKSLVVVAFLLLLVVLVRVFWPQRHVAHGDEAMAPATLDRLLAPVALYPDQLLGQVLICSQNPGNVDALHLWMGKNPAVKGTELQDAATLQGFEPSYVTLVLFPQVVKMMADDLDWTTDLGVAFTADRSAVFSSIQRLRTQAHNVGTLKTTPQQEVETRTTSSGEQVIVIEPANPQVVYVPQYNETTVYTQAPSTTVIVVEDDDNTDEVIAAGMIGFTAGIAMGAVWSNPYYYGPHGWYGGGYMYNDAWDDYYDHREDAREDWTDHREDMAEERGDRADDAREERTDRTESRQDGRTDRQENRQENRPESQADRQQRANDAQAQRADGTQRADAQAQRQERTGDATSQRTGAQTQRQPATTTGTQSATQRAGAGSASRGTTESRGQTDRPTPQAREQGARTSTAFSGYSSGSSARTTSQRGTASRASAGGSRSSGGGGGRRR